MKKKVVLVIAIALIAVTMCVMLVGCSPKNPVDFLDKWEKAEAKAYYTASAECLINGDTLIIKDKSIAGSEYTYIYEIVGDKFNCYMGIKEGSSPVVWEATTGSLSDTIHLFSQNFYQIHHQLSLLVLPDYQLKFLLLSLK